MTAYDITIVSDTVCPFCHLGRVRLGRAIALHQKTVRRGSRDSFTIRWHALYLNRAAPSHPYSSSSSSETLRDAVARRFGTARMPSKEQRMAALGASEGLCFTLDGRIGNSRDSHRIIQLGRARGGPALEDAVAQEVMRMFFEGGGDITAWDDLVAAAARAGLDEEDARAWLRDGKGGEEADREAAEAETMGMKGAPTFIINGKHRVEGAEDVFAFMEQFMEIKKGEPYEESSDEE